MRRLRFAQTARADITSIFEYLARDNVNAAGRVVGQIERACKELVDLPERYAVDINRPSGALRRRPVGRYNIYYLVSDTWVEIARILHSAQDIDEIFPDD